MENFVFPDEIKTKLMKMSKLTNIFYVPKNYGKALQAAFSEMKSAFISFTECASNYSKLVNLFGKRHSVSEQLFKWLPKSSFSLAIHHSYMKTWIKLETTFKPPPRIPSFWHGVICHIWKSQFGGHRNKHTVCQTQYFCNVTRIIDRVPS